MTIIVKISFPLWGMKLYQQISSMISTNNKKTDFLAAKQEKILDLRSKESYNIFIKLLENKTMGDIYMLIDPMELTPDMVKNISLNYMSKSERRELIELSSENDAIRSKLFELDLPWAIQLDLFKDKEFTEDELNSLFENSQHIDENITNLVLTLSSEILLKYGHKLDLFRVENQLNITPEFVNKYYDRMDLQTFVRVRIKRGDINEFLQCPGIAERAMKELIRYSSSKEDIISAINSYYQNDEEKTEIIVKVNELFDFRVNVSTLTEFYNNENNDRSYSTSAVLDYFESKYNNMDATWSEFVKYDNENDLLLAEILFRDIMCKVF